MSPTLARPLADLVLALHAGIVAFVVLGLPLIVAGGFLGWSWIRNPWFRLAHLAAIGVVALQSWLGVICPLTTLEMHLRAHAGDATYRGAFFAHWLQRLLYYEAPPWVFVAGYPLFGVVVAVSWRFPPRSFRRA